MPFDPSQTYGAATVTPAGAGQTVGAASSGVQFWSPSKYAMIVDSRPVPGMVSQGNSVQGTASERYQLDSGQTPTFSSTSTLGDAMNQLLNLGQNSPDMTQKLQDQLIKGGFLDPTKKNFQYGAINSGDPTYDAYYNLLENSIRTGTDYSAILAHRVANDAGKKFEAAFQLQKDKLQKQQDAAAAALLPKTVTRTAINIADPLTAQNLLQQTLTNELGRNPTTDEINQFTQALQTAQAASPTLTTAVTDPGQVQDKSAVQTGGFDPTQFTQNYVDQNFGQEKDSVGGATNFYKVALDTLGAGGRGY